MKRGIFVRVILQYPPFFWGVWYPLVGLLYQITKTSHLMVPSSSSTFFLFLKKISFAGSPLFFPLLHIKLLFKKSLLFMGEKPLTLISFFNNYYPYPIIKNNSFLQHFFSLSFTLISFKKKKKKEKKEKTLTFFFAYPYTKKTPSWKLSTCSLQ